MGKTIRVSASILSSDFSRLGDEIKKCEDAGVDMIHVDVMDGHFVPNISIGIVIVEAVRKITRLPIDTHLMIEHPGAYVEKFARAGSDWISIHAECYGPRRAGCRGYGEFPKEVDTIDAGLLKADIAKIKKCGKRALVVLNPGTPQCLDAVLSEIDGVLVMSVNPGFSGQEFDSRALAKIEDLRGKFAGDISVDGGVNDKTAPLAVRAGASVLATASYFFGAPDARRVVNYLKALK